MKGFLMLLALIYGSMAIAKAADPDSLRYPRLVKAFYERRPGLRWFGGGSGSDDLRLMLWRWVDSSRYLGLDSSRYHYLAIRRGLAQAQGSHADSLLDVLFTDAALTMACDLHGGFNVYGWIRYDELAKHSSTAGDLTLATALAAIQDQAGLDEYLRGCEPRSAEYTALRRALRAQLGTLAPLRAKKITVSMNYLRWIDRFGLPSFIVVNIASATLRFYDHDSIRIRMKVVAGKPATPTPRFSAHCTEVILYPYWYVPKKIAVKEFVPLFRTDPSLADIMGMDVLDAGGRPVDANTLPWETFGPANFPYQLRQLTGCANALGVIKFELSDPFGVYMHDTNLKSAFGASSRYFSHGCIRLEKPFLLARELLGTKLDTMYLTECRRDQKPKRIRLEKPVPVFVVYMPVEADEAGNLTWYKDSYHLLRRK